MQEEEAKEVVTAPRLKRQHSEVGLGKSSYFNEMLKAKMCWSMMSIATYDDIVPVDSNLESFKAEIR